MATIRRFEDIEAWKRARDLTKEAYTITKAGEFARDLGLRDQIRRASVSIMANIAEGFGRNSDKEFAHFFNIAIASAVEVQSHLYVALDQNYVEDPTFQKLYALAAESIRLSKAFAQRLRQ
jgi:four helix bundle protein